MKNNKEKELIPVREGEDFNREAVELYLKKHLTLPDGPMEVQQFSAGSSNLTYLISIGEWEGVLRRPPFGPLPPKAHDMKRESGLLMKLHPEYNLVPNIYLFCDDESIIGAPFYIMEYKKGIVLNDSFPEGFNPTEDTKKGISKAFVDTLVQLHDVDYKKAGLESLGYPKGFTERQVRGWTKRYLDAKTDEIDSFDRVAKWVSENIPRSIEVSVIHNDFKLNNILLSSDYTKVNAVFDWEMATIADPLFDLGITLGYWVQENDPEFLRHVLPTVTYQPGFYTRREIIESYAEQTGRDVSDIHFYIVFSYFRLAGVLQQIYYRYKTGQTNDERFKSYGTSVKNLLDYADYISDKKSY